MIIWEIIGISFVCALLLGLVRTMERRRAEKLVSDRVDGELSTLRAEVNRLTMAVDGLEGRGESQAQQMSDMLGCLDEMAREMYPSLYMYPSLWRRHQGSSNTSAAA